MTPWPLSVAFPLTLLGAVALVLTVDAGCAWFTREEPAVYRRLWPLQFGCYVVIGFVAMLTTLELRYVELIGAIAGFVSATLGWAITWRIGPGRLDQANLVSIAVVVGSMTAFAFGLAILGALIFNVAARVMIHPPG
ncbi:MAG TPA: hypothetical protein VK669_13670 [Candidatus Limnocylindrales bacterium]|nr:hypothetical protein [Candidatus Limnocylindrales bacterium]